jgi:hypothetical protein
VCWLVLPLVANSKPKVFILQTQSKQITQVKGNFNSVLLPKLPINICCTMYYVQYE